MRLEFFNCWTDNSMKPGGAFPISFIDIYADLHPSYRFLEIKIFNFGVSLCFRTKNKESPEQRLFRAIQEAGDKKP